MSEETQEAGKVVLTVEKSFTVAVIPGDLFSVDGKICKTSTEMLGAIKTLCGIVKKPRAPKEKPASPAKKK